MRISTLFTVLFTVTIFAQNPANVCKKYHSEATSNSLFKKRGVSDSRMNEYDVKFYNLDLNVSNTNTNISGFVESKIESKIDNFNSIVFDLVNGFTIDSIVVNKTKQTKTYQDNKLVISLNKSFNKGEYITTRIYYKGKCNPGSTFPIGLLNGKNNYNNSYTYTVSEPFHSYLWWPCKQDLNDKADSVYINVTTENTNTVASNGLLKNTVNVVNNKKRYEWKTYYPIQYYLIAFSTGPYFVKNSYAKPKGINDSILIQDFLYSANEATYFANELASTRKLIEAYSDRLGIYPFYKEKYGHFMAPSQVGALENQTITMIGNYYSQNTVNHELAHQWFGDNNTCEKWNEIWLHEGFASYFGAVLGGESLTGKINFQNLADIVGSITSAPSDKSTYVSDKDVHDPNLIFDYVNVYEKGAMVLSMLRFELGDSLFFEVLKSFYQKNKGGLMNTQSLIQTVNDKSGKDYTYFFNQWVYGYGFPSYDLDYFQKGDSAVIQTSQSVSSALTSFYKMGIDFNLISDNDTIYVKGLHDSYNKVYYFNIPNFKLKSIQVNPFSYNLLKVNSVTKKVLSNLKEITSYKFASLNVTGTIVGDTIKVALPYGSDKTKLVATFQYSLNAKVSVNSVVQVSGVTQNNFSNKITYLVTAEDGTTRNYVVIVSVLDKPKSSEKTLFTFSFDELVVNGKIMNKTVDLLVPSNSDLTSIKTKFTISSLAKLYINNIEQISGVTITDFSKPVSCSVVAEDGSKVDYLISIHPAQPEDNLMLSFGFVGFPQKATINGFAVRITLPLGTDITNLNAVWTISNGAYVRYNNETLESSGNNQRDYTTPIIYAVIGSGPSALYKIFVTLKNEEPKSNENKLLSFGFLNTKSTTSINDSMVIVSLPGNTQLNALIAEFTISAKANVFVDQIEQQSGVTVNDFTKNLNYKVVAENGLIRFYKVEIIKIDTIKNQGFLNFEITGIKGTITDLDSIIKIVIPANTDVTKLAANFNVQSGAIVKVGDSIQVSGVTENDFTNGVTFTITLPNGQLKTIKVVIEKEQLSGVETTSYKEIEMYPNPANGNLFIQAETGTLKIEIKDLQGRIVYHQELSNYQGEKIHLDLNEIATALIFVHIWNNTYETIKKIEIVK